MIIGFNNELNTIYINCIPTDITSVRYIPFGQRGLNNPQNNNQNASVEMISIL